MYLRRRFKFRDSWKGFRVGVWERLRVAEFRIVEAESQKI